MRHVITPITGPLPQIPPTLAGSSATSALAMGTINQQNASALTTLAGGYKGRSKRTHKRVKRTTKSNKMRPRKTAQHRRTRRHHKRSRLYKGGATGDPLPYSAPAGSNPAVLAISEKLATAHANAYMQSALDKPIHK